MTYPIYVYQTMPSNAWFVYIVLAENNSLYTGITTDTARRFQEHLDTANKKPGAKGAKFFRRCAPLKIVYSEACATRSEASRREAEIKALNPAQKKALCTL
jgi:putative endonuclease